MNRRSLVRHVLPGAVGVGVVALILGRMDWGTLVDALKSSRWSFVIAAGFLNLVPITLSRAKRFNLLIDRLPHQGRPARFLDILRVLTASRALNLVLPGRAGETLRALQLKRRFGYEPESVVAAFVIETLLEVVALGTLAFVLLCLGWGGVQNLLYPFLAFAGLCLLLGVAFAVSGKLRRSIRLLTSPGTWLGVLGLTWVADFFDVAMIGLCLASVGISLDAVAWFLVLAGINLAIVIPAPGNVGTLEAGAVITLSALGVDQGHALAFALLYHSAHLVPIMLLGSVSLPLELLKGREVRELQK